MRRMTNQESSFDGSDNESSGGWDVDPRVCHNEILQLRLLI